jgi:hypothetical protein
MLAFMAVGEVRPGYELWRPNREKAESVTTKFVIVVLLLATAAVSFLVTIGGFSVLQGGIGMGIIALLYCALYVMFAFFVARWNRGVLPMAAASSVLLLIFAAVGAGSWFDRDKSGFSSTLLPPSLIGLLMLILIPLSILVVAISLVGFNQEWHVEEERPIGQGEDYGAGSEPPPGEGPPAEEPPPQPA